MFRLHLQTTKGPSIILFNLKTEVSVRHLNFQDMENMYDAPPSEDYTRFPPPSMSSVAR
jgi:hypothetical protein